MSDHKCVGGCRRVVTEEGKYCVACWPIDVSSKHVDPKPTPSVSSSDLREEILRAAYMLRFGTQTEQAEALETLSHRVAVLQTETQQTPQQKDQQTP